MKLNLILLVYFLLIGITGSFAEELRPHIVELGTETYYFRYKEPGVMKEDGIFYGLTGSYRYHDMLNSFMLKAEGRGAWGEVDYKNSGTLNGIRDYVFEFRGLAGYDFTAPANFTLTPYFGFGYRLLNDDTSGKVTSTGASGYERESNYFYSPLGLEIHAKIQEGWRIVTTVEYDIFLGGEQESHLSDANASLNNLKNKQKNGYGARGSIKLLKQGDKLDFVIEPFVRYWNIAQSKGANVTYAGVIIGHGYEPKNNTIESGVKITAQF